MERLDYHKDFQIFHGKVTRIKTIKINSGLVGFRPVRSKLATHCQADNSKCSNTHSIVSSCDSCWSLKSSCLHCYSCPWLTKTFLAGWESFYSKNLLILSLACTELTQCLESRARFFFLFWSWSGPDKDIEIEMSDERTGPEASQSSVAAETMAPSTSSSAASSTVTSSAGLSVSYME